MYHRARMTTETTFFALLIVASLVAMFARFVQVPYTVALVIAGLGLGAVPSSVLDLDSDAGWSPTTACRGGSKPMTPSAPSPP
jgi:Kef-type K+ transport system membrane component KefB